MIELSWKSVVRQVIYATIAIIVSWMNLGAIHDFLHGPWTPTLAIIIVVNLGIVAAISLQLRVLTTSNAIDMDFTRTTDALRDLSIEEGAFLLIAFCAVIFGQNGNNWTRVVVDAALIYTVIGIIFNEIDLRNAVVELLPQPAAN